MTPSHLGAAARSGFGGLQPVAVTPITGTNRPERCRTQVDPGDSFMPGHRQCWTSWPGFASRGSRLSDAAGQPGGLAASPCPLGCTRANADTHGSAQPASLSCRLDRRQQPQARAVEPADPSAHCRRQRESLSLARRGIRSTPASDTTAYPASTTKSRMATSFSAPAAAEPENNWARPHATNARTATNRINAWRLPAGWATLTAAMAPATRSSGAADTPGW
jgi:hypothetical protein